MANKAVDRVKKEFQEVLRSKDIHECSIKLELVNDTWTELRGEIIGPPDTPYEGGVFRLEIKIPDHYPFVPPKVKFLTPLYHPNVSSQTGCICLDILKDNWAAVMNLRTVLLSIQALLSAAEPDDPQDAVVAAQYKKHKDLFTKTARHWTSAYAKGPHRVPEFDLKVRHLQDMGIQETEARMALSKENWNVEKAIENIFS